MQAKSAIRHGAALDAVLGAEPAPSVAPIFGLAFPAHVRLMRRAQKILSFTTDCGRSALGLKTRYLAVQQQKGRLIPSICESFEVRGQLQCWCFTPERKHVSTKHRPDGSPS